MLFEVLLEALSVIIHVYVQVRSFLRTIPHFGRCFSPVQARTQHTGSEVDGTIERKGLHISHVQMGQIRRYIDAPHHAGLQATVLPITIQKSK